MGGMAPPRIASKTMPKRVFFNVLRNMPEKTDKGANL
jgi:hypothetical protein